MKRVRPPTDSGSLFPPWPLVKMRLSHLPDGLTAMTIRMLSEMTHGQAADLFVLLTTKEELTTREAKPYFKVGFRDHAREVTFPIWNDSPWGADCRASWQPGAFYKVRAVYRDTNYGPQLDLRKVREVCEAD